MEKEALMEKLNKLVELGKSKKNSLDMNEISEFFNGVTLQADQWNMIYQYLEEKGIDVLRIMDDDMSLEELKSFSPEFEEDVYDAISMETCVNKRLTVGAPGEEAMKKVIAVEEEYLSHDWQENIHVSPDIQ